MFGKKDNLNHIKNLLSVDDIATIDENNPEFLQSLISQVAELENKLKDQQHLIHSLEKDAMTDSLTGLVNRRFFEHELEKSLSFVKRHNRKSAVLFIDIDSFKSINDQFGHLAGDNALCHIANILLKNVRPTDIVSRLGGDEFCIILNEVTSSYDVNKRCEILESLVARTPLTFDDKNIQLTISIGSKTFGSNDSIEDIMSDADSTMYLQKNSKN